MPPPKNPAPTLIPAAACPDSRPLSGIPASHAVALSFLRQAAGEYSDARRPIMPTRWSLDIYIPQAVRHWSLHVQ